MGGCIYICNTMHVYNMINQQQKGISPPTNLSISYITPSAFPLKEWQQYCKFPDLNKFTSLTSLNPGCYYKYSTSEPCLVQAPKSVSCTSQLNIITKNSSDTPLSTPVLIESYASLLGCQKNKSNPISPCTCYSAEP